MVSLSGILLFVLSVATRYRLRELDWASFVASSRVGGKRGIQFTERTVRCPDLLYDIYDILHRKVRLPPMFVRLLGLPLPGPTHVLFGCVDESVDLFGVFLGLLPIEPVAGVDSFPLRSPLDQTLASPLPNPILLGAEIPQPTTPCQISHPHPPASIVEDNYRQAK